MKWKKCAILFTALITAYQYLFRLKLGMLRDIIAQQCNKSTQKQSKIYNKSTIVPHETHKASLIPLYMLFQSPSDDLRFSSSTNHLLTKCFHSLVGACTKEHIKFLTSNTTVARKSNIWIRWSVWAIKNPRKNYTSSKYTPTNVIFRNTEHIFRWNMEREFLRPNCITSSSTFS